MTNSRKVMTFVMKLHFQSKYPSLIQEKIKKKLEDFIFSP